MTCTSQDRIYDAKIKYFFYLQICLKTVIFRPIIREDSISIEDVYSLTFEEDNFIFCTLRENISREYISRLTSLSRMRMPINIVENRTITLFDFVLLQQSIPP